MPQIGIYLRGTIPPTQENNSRASLAESKEFARKRGLIVPDDEDDK